MGSVKAWIDRNVDKRQLTTIVAASVVIGGVVFVSRKAGFGVVGQVFKGG